MELAAGRRRQVRGGLTMAAISSVFTIARVAAMLSEDEDGRHEISIEMEPEDGRLSVLGIGDEETTAFTRDGVDNLKELIDIHKADPHLLARYKPHG